MADSGVNIGGGEDKDVEQEEKEEDNNNVASCGVSTTASCPLTELNLLIILSFLSLSPKECSDLEEEIDAKKMESAHKDSRTRQPLSPNSLQGIKERQMYEFRAPERQSARLHPKIKDCRHFRRM